MKTLEHQTVVLGTIIEKTNKDALITLLGELKDKSDNLVNLNDGVNSRSIEAEIKDIADAIEAVKKQLDK